jgi:hypothetical protein|eukprot:jgi/Chrpa1/10840/Chrysochromulina_OHIO_Genome00015704-RA
MKLSALLISLLHASSALRTTPRPIDRRTAIYAAATALPLFAAAAKVKAITAYAADDFKDGKYVGPSVVGSAPNAEGEAKFEEIYLAAVKKQEKEVQAMGFELDEEDRKEVEMVLRTQYCGFQAKLKCKGSPAAKNGGR